jgi:two-component system, NtrC family, response regulator HydG
VSTVLIVDDEEVIRFAFKTHLSKEGYTVITAHSYPSALEFISETDLDVIVADIVLESYTGIDLLKEVKRLELNVPVIMITGVPDIKTASDAVRLGAFDYLPKPVHKKVLLHTIRLAIKHKALVDEKEGYRRNLEAIFSSMNDALLTVDSEMRVLEANDAAQRVWGLPPGEMTGKFLEEIPITCQRQCCSAISETLETGKPIRERRVESRHDALQSRALMLNTSLLRYGGKKISGAILMARDISRMIFLERELKERHQFHSIIGKSRPMQDVYNLLGDLADTETTVLITGESGTGKELAARALHYEGFRSDKPLVVANCSSFSENLLESELFGHVKGAFTGAVKDKIGRFQLAHGGTLFLDEVGDISPFVQLKLLRVLQEKEIERVGDATPIPVDVRVIAATHRNLEQMVARGEFRKDLYYRIKVVEVKLPPLRKRSEDIPLLVDHIGHKLSRKMNKPFSGGESMAKAVMETFMGYSWPGNVRELENVLEHAFVVSHGKPVTMGHLPPELLLKTGSAVSSREGRGVDPMPVGEREKFLHVLEKTDWNITKAARLLGISRRTMYRKMDQMKLTRPLQ